MSLAETEIIEEKKKIQDRINDDTSFSGADDDSMKLEIWSRVSESALFSGESFALKSKIASEIFSSMRGLDILDPLISDESITEIMVNGKDCVFYERNGKLETSALSFESEEKLLDIIQRIVGKAGREINTANPIADARLSDGSRVCAVIPPVSITGPTLNIRKFTKTPMTFNRLIELGSLSKEAADVLGLLVKCGYNIFISGGTGAGKTSFLNALADCIPKGERIVTIEDSAELNIQSVSNKVCLETRNANSSGNGKITIRNLIRASLRMRPDRIIVGEVRGGEALDMLQAMNTGHDGSLSTGHANSPADMLSRLETMVLEAESGLPVSAIRKQIASGIDIIVHLSRMRDKTRKAVEITEVVDVADNEYVLNPLFVFSGDDPDKAMVSGRLERTANPFIKRGKLEKNGRGNEFK